MSIDQLPAGREMDALVAEKVMGWIGIEGKHGHPLEKGPFKDCDCPSHSYQRQEIPHYSSDIAAAWEVAEKLGLAIIPQSSKNGFRWLACDVKLISYKGDRIEVFPVDDTEYSCDTAPLAICRAALKAVEVNP
jgi:hypothetical protein